MIRQIAIEIGLFLIPFVLYALFLVATNVAGSNELVLDGKTGFLVPAGGVTARNAKSRFGSWDCCQPAATAIDLTAHAP